MGYPVQIALRYLGSKKRAFVSVGTAFAMLGVALGVAALAIVMSVTGGFQEQFREKVLGVNAHVIVLKYQVHFRDYRDVMKKVEAVPGVVAASYGNHPPLWLEGGDWEDVRVDGYAPGPDENMKIDVTLTWPGYFSLMRMPLDVGRDFTEADDAASAPVAIVNQAFASRFLSGRPPLDARLWIGGREHSVVGVARTKELFLVGRNFEAARAEEMGLVNRVVDAHELETESVALAADIATGAPLAARGNKYAIEMLASFPRLTSEQEEELVKLRESCFASEDFREGIQAFAEKREPRWKGR